MHQSSGKIVESDESPGDDFIALTTQEHEMLSGLPAAERPPELAWMRWIKWFKTAKHVSPFEKDKMKKAFQAGWLSREGKKW